MKSELYIGFSLAILRFYIHTYILCYAESTYLIKCLIVRKRTSRRGARHIVSEFLLCFIQSETAG